MPIRIKSVHDFGPCVLTLESIQGIIELVERDLTSAVYSANDGIWEVFDEPKESLLTAISQRQTLDSFNVKAESSTTANDKSIEFVFDKDEAKIKCNAHPDHANWFEHFLIDIKKCIRPPSLVQLTVHRGIGKRMFYLRIPLVFIPIDTSVIASTPYCKIVIRKKAPDPFKENIKANIISNIIWAVIVFALGVIATLITGRLIGK